ncbi:transcription factor HES-7.1-A-like [Thunnus thynnus]|uniref:transcription factor HES-7.1-A-like n=1 Tax=Thunnus thynnus TaxID=8237 RepID=UPI003527B498
MKLIQEAEDGANDRKFIKSQVEKRRRERMNRSLECLRTMLLQQPQQPGGTQPRVEKTEILEHTVLFLQNTAKRDNTRAGGEGQKHSFQDGFSTCLQKAAQFLGPEGKGLWLGAALDASFTACLTRSDSDSAGVQRRNEAQFSSSLPHTKSILRMLRQKSKHRLHTRAFNVNSFAPYQLPVQQGCPRVPQQPQRHSQLDIRVERRASKQSSSQSLPVSQTLWRPWP